MGRKTPSRKKTDAHFFTKNETINHIFSRAENILFRLNIDDNVSFDTFEHDFFENKKNLTVCEKTCFYSYSQKFIELNKIKWVSGHIRHYEASVTKFRQEVYIEDINVDFLVKYEQYMRIKLNNASNTVHKTFKLMSPILKYAVLERIIEKNPFDNYKVKKAPTNRDYLTIEELHKLENLLSVYQGNKKHIKCANIFFICLLYRFALQ